MPAPYLLDTNAYAYLLLRESDDPVRRNIAHRLNTSGILSFFLPEIASMEILSVLGQYRRGAKSSIHKCERTVVDMDNGTEKPCTYLWKTPDRKRISKLRYQALQKVVRDVEKKRGLVQATLLPTDKESIELAKTILLKYSERYRLESHDALICGVLLSAIKKGQMLTLVTSDKSLKAVLREEGINVFDPLIMMS